MKVLNLKVHNMQAGLTAKMKQSIDTFDPCHNGEYKAECSLPMKSRTLIASQCQLCSSNNMFNCCYVHQSICPC